MYYLYRIDSGYDGFTPKKIPQRIEGKRYLTYNWNQYFDEVTRGDIIFTYFFGKNVSRGVYLISKAVRFTSRNKVKAKILDYDSQEPIISQEEIAKYTGHIFNRPRGSVFVIPPFLEGMFDKVLQNRVSSDIEISEEIDCYTCFEHDSFPCEKCSIFDTDYLINWQKEVKLSIPGYERIVSPFWIIPRQSHWTRSSIRKHVISRIFYSFKAGYTLYTRLFARGIIKAMKNDPVMKKVNFDYMLGVPISPKKKKRGEIDRVRMVCSELSKLTGIEYFPKGLTLLKHISRKEYRYLYGVRKFIRDYQKRLNLNIKKSLRKKNILIVDDVITDGKTLQAVCEKIKVRYPNSHLYAVTCGIFAKKRNVLPSIVKKFQR